MSNTQVTEVTCRSVDPVDSQLKHHLLARGIMPATWRLLCRTGFGWITEFTVYYRQRSENQIHPEVLVDLVTLVQAFGSQRLVPAWMLQAFMQIGGNPNAPGSNYTQLLNDLFPVCKRLGVLLERVSPDELVVLQDRATEIFTWASRYAGSCAPGVLRRATLPWFIRKVDEAAVLERRQIQGAKAWHVPYRLNRTFKNREGLWEPMYAVILNTPLAVWEEGQSMRHCAGNYIDQCAKGRVLLVSLRSTNKKRPWATVAYNLKNPEVRIAAFSGFANTLVSPSTIEVAKAYLNDLQPQHAQLLLATKSRIIDTQKENT